MSEGVRNRESGEREKHVIELEMEGLRGKVGERPGHGESEAGPWAGGR